MGNFLLAPLLANGFLSLKSITEAENMESDVSVTVLILMLSLFHQNAITSPTVLTTASPLCNMPCPQCSQAFEVSNPNSHILRPSATFCAPRARRPSEFSWQAFPFQVPLLPTVPSVLTSSQNLLQGPQSWREPTIFLLIFWPKLQMKIPSIRELPRPMHLKISGILNPYF